jgi:hypothetical protein
MKATDLWVILFLSSVPVKALPLEGVWKSCEKKGYQGDLEYVVEFKNDELIEDYYGTKPAILGCSGIRLFHYRRTWKLKFNDFNYTTEYKVGRYQFILGGMPPNWYGCCMVRTGSNYDRKPSVCDVHKMPGDHELDFQNQYTYQIKDETLKTTLKGETQDLKRVNFPSLFKIKQSLFSFIYKLTFENNSEYLKY